MNEKLIDSMMFVMGALIIMIVGLVAIKILLKVEKKALSKSKLDPALHLFVLRGTKVVLLVILVIMVLQNLGVSTSSLIAVLGAGGAAIALALKDSLGNVAGGILILLNKPFNRGDCIEIQGSAAVTGIVDSIDLMTTRLNTFDNKIVTVPNGSITTAVLINYSTADIRRVDCSFNVGYNSNIEKVKNILTDVAAGCDAILKDRDPVIGVADQAESALVIDLKVWCRNDDYYNVKYYLEENVKTAFDAEGIEIPYRQVDVRIINHF